MTDSLATRLSVMFGWLQVTHKHLIDPDKFAGLVADINGAEIRLAAAEQDLAERDARIKDMEEKLDFCGEQLAKEIASKVKALGAADKARRDGMLKAVEIADKLKKQMRSGLIPDELRKAAGEE